MSEPRLPGHCATCPKPLYTVEQRMAADHATLPRFPTRLGALEDLEAETITFVLTDGTVTDLSVCSKCAPKIHEPAMMRKAWRAQIALSKLTEGDSDIDAKLKIQLANEPIGILARQKIREKTRG